MSVKRKFNKLVNDPQQFFIDSKIVKTIKSSESKEISKIVQPAPKKEGKSNLEKASTSFRLQVEDASVRSMELVELCKKNLDQGDVIEAVECADRAVALDQRNLFAYLACCQAREKQEGMPLVLDYAKSAYDLFPSNSLAQMNYARSAKNHGIYNDDIESIYTRQYQIEKNEDVLTAYIQYVWEYRVADKKIAATLIEYSNTEKYSDKTIALIGAYIFDADYKKESLKLAKYLIDNKSSKFIKKYGEYYCFSNSYYSIAKTNSDTRTVIAVDKILKGEEGLLKKIRHSNRIVIVGNSPREIGRGMGSNIDSADLVIRFNNYPETDEIKPDYGSKCDIWVRSIGSWVESRDEKNFDHVVVSGTNLLARGFNLNHFLHYSDISTEISVFNSDYHYELIKILNGPPSAGLMMLYMVYRLKGGLLEDDVFGFGFVDQLNENVTNIGKSPAGVRHHWEAELDVYRSMIKGLL